MKEKIKLLLDKIVAFLTAKMDNWKKAQALKARNAPPKKPSLIAPKIQKVISIVSKIIEKIMTPLVVIFEKLKTVKWKSLTPKSLIAVISVLFGGAFFFAKKWVLSLKPLTIVTFTGLSTFGAIIGLNIYLQGNKIYEEGKEEIFGIEDPVTESSKVVRPKYYKQTEKYTEIEDFIIPIYVQTNGLKRSLRISVTVESSNRYIKSFLSKNEYLVRDRINASIEPIVPEFQFSNEGKTILKEKIKLELNKLLKELKVDGEIEKVYFHSIVAD